MRTVDSVVNVGVEKVTEPNQHRTVKLVYKLLISGENPLTEEEALAEIRKHEVYIGDVDLRLHVPIIAKSVLESYGSGNEFPSGGSDCDRLKDILSEQICDFYPSLGERDYDGLKNIYGIELVVSGVLKQLELDLP